MKKRIPAIILLLIFSFSTADAQLIFGVIPLEDSSTMVRQFTPLATYISEQIGDSVTLKIGRNYAEIENGLVQGTIDFAFIGPSGLVKTNLKNPKVIPLAKFIKNGSPYYKSYIFTKKGSNINSLKDLKSKVFAFGDIGSTSSHMVPKHMMSKAGISLHTLSTHVFTGSHTNVVKAVLNGDADAGSCKESVAKKHIDMLKVIAISKPIPEFPIAANLDALGKDMTLILMRTLLHICSNDPAVTAINPHYNKFSPAKVNDYKIIKTIMSL